MSRNIGTFSHYYSYLNGPYVYDHCGMSESDNQAWQLTTLLLLRRKSYCYVLLLFLHLVVQQCVRSNMPGIHHALLAVGVVL